MTTERTAHFESKGRKVTITRLAAGWRVLVDGVMHGIFPTNGAARMAAGLGAPA
jgi:hypothetical protein